MSQSESGQPERKTRVFLSYSRKDEPTILKLTASLQAGGDIEPLRDKKDILPGEEWRTRLEGMVLAADVVLVCLSPDSIASPEVTKEIEIAQRLSKKMLPVVVRTFTEAAPNAVASLNYFFLTDPQSWDAEIASLRSAIHTDIGWLREHANRRTGAAVADGRKASRRTAARCRPRRGGALDGQRARACAGAFAPAS